MTINGGESASVFGVARSNQQSIGRLPHKWVPAAPGTTRWLSHHKIKTSGRGGNVVLHDIPSEPMGFEAGRVSRRPVGHRRGHEWGFAAAHHQPPLARDPPDTHECRDERAGRYRTVPGRGQRSHKQPCPWHGREMSQSTWRTLPPAPAPTGQWTSNEPSRARTLRGRPTRAPMECSCTLVPAERAGQHSEPHARIVRVPAMERARERCHAALDHPVLDTFRRRFSR